jgi:hypothetical protein
VKLAVLWILGLMACFAIAAGLRWLFGPMKAPPGYDIVPEEWTVEAAKRAMQARDEDQ